LVVECFHLVQIAEERPIEKLELPEEWVIKIKTVQIANENAREKPQSDELLKAIIMSPLKNQSQI